MSMGEFFSMMKLVHLACGGGQAIYICENAGRDVQ